MKINSFALVFFIAVEQVLGQSQFGDVVGKLVVGYQGWFATPFDGSPRKRWVHWTINSGPNGTDPPRPGNCKFEIYPDMREYTQRYQTGLASLGNGQPANLFSSINFSSVNLHFIWMAENQIETAALQRFGTDPNNLLAIQQINRVADNVRRAALANGRKYFIMYDVTGWQNFDTELMTDFNNNIKDQHTNFTAYARQNNKPVICIWGIGFSNRPNKPGPTLNLINQFKQNYYVICGVPVTWRTNDGISVPAYAPVYRACNMIQPWSVGTFVDIQNAEDYKARESADLQECRRLGIDYQPVVWPGFAWSNWNTPAIKNQIPRLNGELMWRQFRNLRELQIPNIYVAMFDEYDEGTAIAKAAENAGMKPTNQYFLSLDADGGDLSSDFYLRLVRDGMRLIRGEINVNQKSPNTPPTAHRLATTNNVGQRFQDMMTNMMPSNLMAMLSTILGMMGL